jgi:hypothetical protein
MPSPRSLKVGDRVRFVSLPEEWSQPGYRIHSSSVRFMKALIRRGRSCRVARVKHGGPWIDARFRQKNGSIERHMWMITEKTGWERVGERAGRKAPRGENRS